MNNTEVFMKYLLIILAAGVAVAILLKIFKIDMSALKIDIKRIKKDIVHAPKNYLEDFMHSFQVIRKNLWFFFILFAIFVIDFSAQSLTFIFQKDIDLEQVRQFTASKPTITQLLSMFLNGFGMIDNAYAGIYSWVLIFPMLFALLIYKRFGRYINDKLQVDIWGTLGKYLLITYLLTLPETAFMMYLFYHGQISYGPNFILFIGQDVLFLLSFLFPLTVKSFFEGGMLFSIKELSLGNPVNKKSFFENSTRYFKSLFYLNLVLLLINRVSSFLRVIGDVAIWSIGTDPIKQIANLIEYLTQVITLLFIFAPFFIVYQRCTVKESLVKSFASVVENIGRFLTYLLITGALFFTITLLFWNTEKYLGIFSIYERIIYFFDHSATIFLSCIIAFIFYGLFQRIQDTERQEREISMKRILIYAISGILIFIFGFLAGSFWTNGYISISGFGEKNIKEIALDFPSSKTEFWESKYFGGGWKEEERMESLPEGKGYLTGKFIYNERPAKGIKFKMFLNNKYKTHFIVSGEDGAFTIRLPEGECEINSIQCKEWKDRPEGSFILVSGDERKMDKASLQDLFFQHNDTGKKVLVTNAKPEKEQIIFAIRPRIKILWPEEGTQKQKATITGSKIIWQPYPDAKDYAIKIDRVTREGIRSTTYMPIIYKKLSGETSLSLSNLPHTRDTAAKEEYAVSVQAYGQHGEFISESGYMVGTFSLTDGNVLVEIRDTGFDTSESGISVLDKTQIDKIYQNTKLINAAETLIREEMFNEAENLLKKIKEDDMQGQKTLLRGYLYAAKGNCKIAERFFNLAKEKGEECIPEEYRVNCK